MFIKEAFAQTAIGAASASPQGAASVISSLLPLFLIIVVFYMLVIRPQNKRIQDHQRMIANLQKGDKVVTGGGIIGKVKKVVGDSELVVEIAENVDVHMLRSSIMMVRDTTLPANNDNKK